MLKDAAAASVYGARAASGVIIVSTKTGKIGEAKISVDMYTGINYVSSNDFPDLLNAQNMVSIGGNLQRMQGRHRFMRNMEMVHRRLFLNI